MQNFSVNQWHCQVFLSYTKQESTRQQGGKLYVNTLPTFGWAELDAMIAASTCMPSVHSMHLHSCLCLGTYLTTRIHELELKDTRDTFG
jgi:hypothetical protein